MKKLSKLLKGLKIVGILVLSSCYPISPEFVSDFDSVFTEKSDPDFDFANPALNTYYLADTVIVLTDPNASDTNLEVDLQLILNRVRRNMNQAGYTEITDSALATQADYLVLVSVNRSDNYFSTWWGGWGGWGGWGWWGWGGCCFFPPVVTTSNNRTGAVIVELLEGKSLPQKNETIPEVWYGVGTGLFRGNNTNLTNRTLNAIDQMFLQSPYLNR